MEFLLENTDVYEFQKGATYEYIKVYVLEKYGLKVSSLYISHIKRKCGQILLRAFWHQLFFSSPFGLWSVNFFVKYRKTLTIGRPSRRGVVPCFRRQR